MRRTGPAFMRSEPGALPEEDMIPLCVPEISGREWEYVKDCLDTNWVSSAGAYVDRFEQQIAGYVGLEHAIATSSGTAALHVALLVAGVRPDDEVLVSTLTFIAPVNAIRYASAWPVFVDAEPDYGQIDARLIAEFLERECTRTGEVVRNIATGRRVSAILPVHILGHPVDMGALARVAKEYDLPIIEDATESLGAAFEGKPVGTLGDVACFSFNGNKLITTGGGGMIVTGNGDWAREARYLTTQAKDDPVEFRHGKVGYNYRLSNLQAALGCAQAERIDEYVSRKRDIAARYASGLANVPGIRSMDEAEWAFSVAWLSTVGVDEAKYGMTSRQLMSCLSENRVQARPLWQPGHLSEAHKGSHAVGGGVAERIVEESLSLPSSVGLSEHDQDRVISLIADIPN